MRRLLPILAFLIWVAPAHAAPTITVRRAPRSARRRSTSRSPQPATPSLPLGSRRRVAGRRAGRPAPVRGREIHGDRHGNGSDGTKAQASVTITARLTLTGPKVGTYGRRAVFKGRVVPALRGARISLFAGDTEVRSGKADKKGRFSFPLRLRAPGTFTARFGSVVSNQSAVSLRPALDVALPSSRTVGQPLVLRAAPGRGEAGTWRSVWRGKEAAQAHLRRSRDSAPEHRQGRRLQGPDCGHPERRIQGSEDDRPLQRAPAVSLDRQPRPERAGPRATAGGASVRPSRRGQLLLLRHPRRRPGLPEGERARPDRQRQPTVWLRLQTAQAPLGPVPGDAYRGGQNAASPLRGRGRPVVKRVVHVSTGATGNTPVGRWRIYSKVPGFLPSGMFYSSFFLRGFAIHGYPSVPRTRPRTAACGRRCGSRPASSPRAATAGRSTSTTSAPDDLRRHGRARARGHPVRRPPPPGGRRAGRSPGETSPPRSAPSRSSIRTTGSSASAPAARYLRGPGGATCAGRGLLGEAATDRLARASLQHRLRRRGARALACVAARSPSVSGSGRLVSAKTSVHA